MMLPRHVIQRLTDRANRRVLVALSGGVDSVVLLSLVLRLDLSNLSAVHVNHHLHEAADVTASFCESLAAIHDIPFHLLDVTVSRQGSLEANARTARYAAIEALMVPGDLLLTAHHADDQVETILFRLFRGGAEVGLTGMPEERSLGAGRLYRPMLSLGRREIREFAEAEGLSWQEDPTNQDTSIDRNYIREVLRPAIDARFPQAGQSLLSGLQQDETTRQWMHRRLLEDLAPARPAPDALQLSWLRQQAPQALDRLLVAWLMDLDLPLPAGGMRRELVREILEGHRVQQTSADLAFHQLDDRLIVCHSIGEWQPAPFDLAEGCTLPEISVTNAKVKGQGLCTGEYRVDFRAGGEKIRLGRHRTLKNVFQEHGVPAWLRDRVPLIYAGDQLAATASLPDWGVDMIIADDCQARPGDEGVWVECRFGDRVFPNGAR